MGHLLHAEQAFLQLSNIRLLLLCSVLRSLKGHLALFCFSLVLAECDLGQDGDGGRGWRRKGKHG